MHSMGLPAKSFHGVRIDSPRRDPSGTLSSRKRATSCGRVVSTVRHADEELSIVIDQSCDAWHGNQVLVKILGRVREPKMDTLRSKHLTWDGEVR